MNYIKTEKIDGYFWGEASSELHLVYASSLRPRREKKNRCGERQNIVHTTVAKGSKKTADHPTAFIVGSKIIYYIRFHLSVCACVSNRKVLHLQEMDLTSRPSFSLSGLSATNGVSLKPST